MPTHFLYECYLDVICYDKYADTFSNEPDTWDNMKWQIYGHAGPMLNLKSINY